MIHDGKAQQTQETEAENAQGNRQAFQSDGELTVSHAPKTEEQSEPAIALAAVSFASLLAQEDYMPPKHGEVREGEVLAIEDDVILVDIGAKRDAIIPPRDLRMVDDSVLDDLEVGDAIPVYVLQPRNENNNLIVSLNKGLEQQDWLEARRIMEEEEVFEGKVVDQNKGGLLVDFGNLRAFVPNSLIADLGRGLSQEARQQAKQKMIGDVLHLKMIEVDRRNRRLVASERAALRAHQMQLLRELKVGDVRKGTVSGLTDFGAFVDIGGVDGLVHISELAWQRVDHPSETVQVGDEIEVEVLSVNVERRRVGLSRKRLLPEPWEQAEETYDKGQVLPGRVTNVVDFGAFVELPGGLEGLVHVSQMGAPSDPRKVVTPGESVWVRVLSIDAEARRIGLALEREEGVKYKRRR